MHVFHATGKKSKRLSSHFILTIEYSFRAGFTIVYRWACWPVVEVLKCLHAELLYTELAVLYIRAPQRESE